MVDQIAVVTFTSPASAGNVSVTSPLITESFSCAILIFSHTTTEGSITPDGVVGIGFVSADTADDQEGHQTPTLRDNITTANQAFTTVQTGECVRVVCLHGTTQAIYSASIPGGVELTFSPVVEQLKVTAILFAGLSRATVGTLTATAAGVHEDVGGVGTLYEPHLLFSAFGDGGYSGTQPDGTSSFGVCINDGSVTQVSSFCNFDRASDPGDADGYISSSTFVVGFTGTTRTVRTVTVTSFDSTGFNAISSSGTYSGLYMALKFTNPSLVRLAAAQLAVSASTGLQAFNSFGFTPDVVLGRGTLIDSLNTTTDGPLAGTQGLFVTGRHGSYALSGCHQEGDSAPSDADSIQEASALVMLASPDSSVAWRATWGGATGSGGFYLNFSTATLPGYLTAFGIQINYEAHRVRHRPRRARLRQGIRKVVRPTILGRSAAQTVLSPFRAIERFRRLIRERLFRRPTPPLLEPTDVAPSATGQVAEGDITTAGAVRADVVTGGADAGGVF